MTSQRELVRLSLLLVPQRRPAKGHDSPSTYSEKEMTR